MPKPRWYEKLLTTTRGKVLSLLRADPRTVSELADSLELSGNAVRRHLTALERDGLVETTGVRREGVGKPARVFRLTHEARDFFPRAYATVLAELLSVLERRTSADEVEELLREVGRNLAHDAREAGFPEAGSVEVRVREAARLIEDIGGLPQVERTNGSFRLVGRSCPLAGVVEEHTLACSVAEALLEELVGTPVSQQCRGNGRPTCVFEIEGGNSAESG